MIFLLWLVLVASNCSIELGTLRQVVQTTFARNSSDLSFELEDWVAHLAPITSSLSLHSNEIYRSFTDFDADVDGTVTFQELLDKMGYVPTLRVGPKQLHIGFTGRDNEMQVMWVTQPDKAIKPVVRYGQDPLHLVQASAVWNEYNEGHIGFHGRIYRATMQRLQPSKKYYYQVGDSATGIFSPLKSFKAPPLKGHNLDRINIAVFGDMGSILPLGFTVSQQIIRSHLTSPFDFVFLTGDIAYAGVSSEKQGEIQPLWDLYGQLIEPWASEVPFMPGVGNHEKYYNYSAYQHRYYLPRSEGSGGNFWFSFDYGQLHMVHISSQHPYELGTPQYQFLEKDLQQAKSRGAKWIILGVHRPFYAASDGSYNQHTGLAAALEDLLRLYNVDIVQTGHMHCYERTWPIYKGKAIKNSDQNSTYYLKPKAPIYIVQGTAGALIHETWIDPIPEWSLIRMQRYGFGRITITGNALKYQFISTQGGAVLDEWYLIK